MTPEQTLDWLAEQHKSQCNEDRPVQEWIRSMKLMLPAPVQEPVAWARYPRYTGAIQKAEIVFTKPEGRDWIELYTTPPAAHRQWVGLTDAEVMQTMSGDWTSQFYFARAIEDKLKEKNNG
jgi:hypothetical protein